MGLHHSAINNLCHLTSNTSMWRWEDRYPQCWAQLNDKAQVVSWKRLTTKGIVFRLVLFRKGKPLLQVKYAQWPLVTWRRKVLSQPLSVGLVVWGMDEPLIIVGRSWDTCMQDLITVDWWTSVEVARTCHQVRDTVNTHGLYLVWLVVDLHYIMSREIGMSRLS